MRAVRTTPEVPVSRGKKREKASIAHRLRRSDAPLFLTAVALGGIGVLAIYAAEADYRQLYAINQAWPPPVARTVSWPRRVVDAEHGGYTVALWGAFCTPVAA